MIAFEGALPSDDEICAILAAFQALAAAKAPARPDVTAWTLAMRHDDLDHDDLRALLHVR